MRKSTLLAVLINVIAGLYDTSANAQSVICLQNYIIFGEPVQNSSQIHWRKPSKISLLKVVFSRGSDTVDVIYGKGKPDKFIRQSVSSTDKKRLSVKLEILLLSVVMIKLSRTGSIIFSIVLQIMM